MRTSRRELLAAAGATCLVGAGARGTPSLPSPKRLITVLAKGGWDTTFCLDPKLGVPTIEGPEVDETDAPGDVEALATWGDLRIVVNERKRPSVAAWFERWHPYAHVVNGIWMGSIAHDPCRFRILTGTTFSSHPDVATILGATTALTEPLGTIDLSGWSLPGSLAASSGSIGYQSQLRALIDPTTQFRAPTGASYPRYSVDAADAELVAAHLAARADAFATTRAGEPRLTQRIADLHESWDRAQRLRDQATVVAGQLPFGQQPDLRLQIEVAVDLLDAGVCRSVTLETRSDWDTHDQNVLQHGFYEALFANLDQLALLLEERGMLESTLVAVLSEMTRTPLRNGTGKDHWPHTSALFFGGGVAGAARSGGTDDNLESLPVDLATGEVVDTGTTVLRYDNLAAGILAHLDVDPEPWLPGVVPFGGLGGAA